MTADLGKAIAAYTAPAAGTLPVIETFGPTVQGEGPLAGRHARFVRLAGCNLRCAACDTPYSWNPDRVQGAEHLTLADLAGPILPEETGHFRRPTYTYRLVVITGGEPLLHQTNPVFAAFVDVMVDNGIAVQIETNGTIAPSPSLIEHNPVLVRFVVSPKVVGPLASDPVNRRIRPRILDAFSDLPHAEFKFVVSSTDELPAVDALVKTHRIDAHRVWIMPEGITSDAVTNTLRTLAGPVVKRGYNLSPRLHIMIGLQ